MKWMEFYRRDDEGERVVATLVKDGEDVSWTGSDVIREGVLGERFGILDDQPFDPMDESQWEDVAAILCGAYFWAVVSGNGAGGEEKGSEYSGHYDHLGRLGEHGGSLPATRASKILRDGADSRDVNSKEFTQASDVAGSLLGVVRDYADRDATGDDAVRQALAVIDGNGRGDEWESFTGQGFQVKRKDVEMLLRPVHRAHIEAFAKRECLPSWKKEPEGYVVGSEREAKRLSKEAATWEDKRAGIAAAALSAPGGVAVMDHGELVGAVSFPKQVHFQGPAFYPNLPGGDYLFVAMLATKRSGYGRRVLQLAIDEAKRRGLGIVLASTESAEGFYDRMGAHQGAGRRYWTAEEIGTLQVAKKEAEKTLIDDEPADGVFAADEDEEETEEKQEALGDRLASSLGGLEGFTWIPGFVSSDGALVEEQPWVDLIIKATWNCDRDQYRAGIDAEFGQQVESLLEEQLGQSLGLEWHGAPYGPNWPYIALWDLVCQPSDSDTGLAAWVWIPAFVSVSGSVVYLGDGERSPNDMDLVIRAETAGDRSFLVGLDDGFALKLQRALGQVLGADPDLIWNADEGQDGVPLYDLVLQPREVMEVVWLDEPGFAESLYKELGEKGGPGSGNWGHSSESRRGSEGGGSDPGKGGAWNVVGYVEAKMEALRKDSIKRQLQETLQRNLMRAGKSEQEAVHGAQQLVDVMALSPDRFDYYADKYGGPGMAEMKERFLKEDVFLTRERARLVQQVRDDATMKQGKYPVDLVTTTKEIADLGGRVAAESVHDTADMLVEACPGLKLGYLSPDARKANESMTTILDLANKMPIVKKLLSDGSVTMIEFVQDNDGPMGRMHGSWMDVNLPTWMRGGTYSSLVIHELGHAFEQWATVHAGFNLYAPKHTFSGGKHVSMYGWKNPGEDFAEMFVTAVAGTPEAKAFCPDKLAVVQDLIARYMVA